MTSRQRFWETMHYGRPDRLPYFEEGIREHVEDVPFAHYVYYRRLLEQVVQRNVPLS